MFQVVTLIFKCVKSLIFNFPSCAAAFNQLNNIVFGDRDIGYPAVMIVYFVALEDRIFKVIDVIGIFCSIQWDIINPFIKMSSALVVANLQFLCFTHLMKF